MIEENYARYREAGKPIVFSVFGGATSEASVASLAGAGSVMGDVYDTVACLGGLYDYRRRGTPFSERSMRLHPIG